MRFAIVAATFFHLPHLPNFPSPPSKSRARDVPKRRHRAICGGDRSPAADAMIARHIVESPEAWIDENLLGSIYEMTLRPEAH
jgi:hypothetical protein